MKIVEGFAGAGGAAKGQHDAGLEHVACVEWDADAAATLKAAGFPATCGDVRAYDWAQHRGIWGAWFSPPCQAFSSAGDRLAANDPRNGWPWTFDAIDACKPRWVICENVQGLLQHKKETCGDVMACPGCYYRRWILPEFRKRFPWVGVAVLNAADYGVPQIRWRVFLVGGPGPVRWPQPTHGPPGQLGLFRTLKPWVTVGEALGLNGHVYSAGTTGEGRPTAPTATIGTKGNAYVVEQSSKTSAAKRDRGIDEPAPTIDTVPGHLRRGSLPQAQRDLRLDLPADTLMAGRKGDSHKAPSVRVPRRPSATVTATEGRVSPNESNHSDHRRAGNMLRRRLTVAECARLQDFPDDWPWQGNKTSRYRQVGNAVPPTLARVVAEAVIAADRAILKSEGAPGSETPKAPMHPTTLETWDARPQ